MDLNSSKLANIIYQERLQEAAMARHIRENGTPSPSLQKRLLSSLGSFLITSGQKLKAHTQANPTTSILEWSSRVSQK